MTKASKGPCATITPPDKTESAEYPSPKKFATKNSIVADQKQLFSFRLGAEKPTKCQSDYTQENQTGGEAGEKLVF